LAVKAAFVSHIVAFLAKAGACHRVSILVAALFTTFANAAVDIEVVADACEASISRLALRAARNDAAASLALALVQIVTFFALNAA